MKRLRLVIWVICASPGLFIAGALSNGKPRQEGHQQHQQRAADEMDTDELGLLLFRGLGSAILSVVDGAGDLVRVVGDTAAGATGGSVKVAGGAVKGIAGIVENIGETTKQTPLPGGEVLGNAIGILGTTVRGIGDTVLFMGSVTENITAATGMVAEQTVRGIGAPIQLLTEAIDANIPSDMEESVTAASAVSTETTVAQQDPGQGGTAGDPTAPPESHSLSSSPPLPSSSGETPRSSGWAAVAESLSLVSVVDAVDQLSTWIRDWAAGLVATIDSVPPLAPHLLLALLGAAALRRRCKREWQRISVVAGAWIYVVSVDRDQRLRLSAISHVKQGCHAPGSGTFGSYGSFGGQRAESVSWLNELIASQWHIAAKHTVCHDICGGPLCTAGSGGFGPFLAKTLLASIEDQLHTSEAKPDTVAHVKADSLSLGTDPPRLTSVTVVSDEAGFPPVESLSKDVPGGHPVRLRLQGHMIFPESVFVLSLGVTSLRHAFLPRFQLRVSHLTMTFGLDLTLTPGPAFPFLQTLDIAFLEQPLVDFAVSPVTGIDLVSLPLVRTWLMSEVAASFEPYLSPRMTQVNLTALYHTTCDDLSAVGVPQGSGASRGRKRQSSEVGGQAGQGQTGLASRGGARSLRAGRSSGTPNFSGQPRATTAPRGSPRGTRDLILEPVDLTTPLTQILEKVAAAKQHRGWRGEMDEGPGEVPDAGPGERIQLTKLNESWRLLENTNGCCGALEDCDDSDDGDGEEMAEQHEEQREEKGAGVKDEPGPSPSDPQGPATPADSHRYHEGSDHTSLPPLLEAQEHLRRGKKKIHDLLKHAKELVHKADGNRGWRPD